MVSTILNRLASPISYQDVVSVKLEVQIMLEEPPTQMKANNKDDPTTRSLIVGYIYAYFFLTKAGGSRAQH